MTTISARGRWIPAALGAALLLSPAATTAQQAPRSTGGLGVETGNFDPSVRPQDDFFRHVNGGWLSRTEIPADRSSYGSFVELRDKSETALREIIEQAAADRAAAAGSDAQKVRDLYLSYMDTERIESLGLGPIRADLDRVAKLRSRSQLPELLASMHRTGVQTPFGFYVGQDGKQATRYIAYLSQSGLGMPDRDYYLREGANFDGIRTAYRGYLQTLFRLSGERDPAAAARAVYALEERIASSHWERAKNRDRELTYNHVSIAGLDEMTPGFSWSRFLKAAGAERTPGVVVRQPDYLRAAGRLLAETPLPVLRQYLTARVLNEYAPVLPAAYADAAFDYRGRTLSGLEEERPRWKRGVGTVNGVLGEVVGRMYVERHFTPEQKTRMQELVSNLNAAFREGIERLEWMSPETRAEAQAKLARFTVKIGYPDTWRDYSALEIREGDLVGNLRRSSEFGFNRMVDRLGKPIDRSEWGMTPQTVNAYYSSTMNEIVFPAAILQPPFFDMSADDAVNYGAIGGVIGHEISHGFDDQGRRSDGEGNLRDWWTEADNAAFKHRADALVAQYAAFSPVEGLNVNGRLTLGENIGDLSGLAVAYQAYRRSLNGREAPVIGGFTGDQRFFLGWAQIWRNKYRDEALRQQLLTDSHSPGEYRVNGVLRNMPEFYAAFGVKPGDGMYLPEDRRVKIW